MAHGHGVLPMKMPGVSSKTKLFQQSTLTFIGSRFCGGYGEEAGVIPGGFLKENSGEFSDEIDTKLGSNWVKSK